MSIGIARTSTGEPLLDLQLDALTGAGWEPVIADTLGGAKSSQPGKWRGSDSDESVLAGGAPPHPAAV